MNFKTFWKPKRAQRWAITAAPPAMRRTPSPFQSLTRDESIAILDDAVQWLTDEASATMLMPDSPSKERRKAELCGRDNSMVRDFQRLVRNQEG
jgi:hypothetical protein